VVILTPYMGQLVLIRKELVASGCVVRLNPRDKEQLQQMELDDADAGGETCSGYACSALAAPLCPGCCMILQWWCPVLALSVLVASSW
jgi:hypothetical protein